MADYSSASSSAESALAASIAGGLVESYTHGQTSVQRGSLKSQIDAATRLEGLAVRRANGGLLHLAKPQEPSA